MKQAKQSQPKQKRWLNRTVLGFGLASLLSDWSHEIATAIMPAFLATMGAAAAWLGVIEGVSDGLSSFAKMGSGYFTDQLRRRKPIAVVGYIVTATGTACIGLATQAWHVLLCRSSAWLGRGVRTPVRKTLLAAAVTPETYGRAFGFERMMDTCGAIVGPLTATVLLVVFGGNFSRVLLVTLVPGLLAAAAIGFLVEEKERIAVKYISFRARLTALPKPFQRFLLAVGLFGAGDFAHSMLILLATQKLKPQYGAGGAATIAVSLYVLHNVLYAGFAFVAGWLADHFNKRLLLAGGYALAAVMGLVLVFAPMNPASSGITWPYSSWCSFSPASTSPPRRRWRIRWQPSWWTRNITAWVSVCWRRSTASAISFRASLWARCGRHGGRRWRSLIAPCCSRRGLWPCGGCGTREPRPALDGPGPAQSMAGFLRCSG